MVSASAAVGPQTANQAAIAAHIVTILFVLAIIDLLPNLEPITNLQKAGGNEFSNLAKYGIRSPR
jgi:hypothetical protein